MAEAGTSPAPRLYGLIARAAPVGVLFRRGPSKQVLLVYWDMEQDRFYPGQWLKGRIYERRCDLSPSGRHLVYLAANQKPPLYSWTAISRPPYLTAVVFWPNTGTWGGGGLFTTENRLCLNHRSWNFTPAEGTRVPCELKVTPLGPYSGHGEDRPILNCRLRRDGWELVQEGREIEHQHGAPLWIAYNPPAIWSRPQSQAEHPWEFRMIERGLKERRGSWHVIEYALRQPFTGALASLGRLDWADWCHSGDLVFVKDGCVWRLPAQELGCESPLKAARLLVDLSLLTFRELPPPPQAKDWSAEVPLPPPYPNG